MIPTTPSRPIRTHADLDLHQVPVRLVQLMLTCLVAFTPAQAQTVLTGFIVQTTEGGGCEPWEGTGRELFALKLPVDETDTNDWLWSTPRSTTGGTNIAGFTHSVLGGNFNRPEQGGDRFFLFMTAPSESRGVGLRMAVDSSSPTGPTLDATTFQVAGETLSPEIPNHAGTGLVLPGIGTYQPVRIDWADEVISYPRVAGDDLQVVFGAFVDYQPAFYELGTRCGYGGQQDLPSQPGKGAILGYNVYSRVGHFAPSSWETDDWLAFVPHVDVAGALHPPPPGTPSGILDFDGLPYDGDELVYFRHEDGAVFDEGEPNGRWYAIQPVVPGDHLAFDETSEIARTPLGFDPRQPDGGLDLDGDGLPEFISPHAVLGGLPGLGMTHAGAILTSASVYSFPLGGGR